MASAQPPVTIAWDCLDNEGMEPEDPQARLGAHVIARRVELGYKTRAAFADATNFGLRTLGDIETGRRPSYDRSTIAALEKALQWTTGTVTRILDGANPATTETAALDDAARTPPVDSALAKVMRSDLSEEKKRELIRMLRDERDAFYRQRAARADELIHLLGGEN